MASFAGFFKSPESARDKYLAHLFGLFSEEVVRAWCAHPRAPYEDLGRPTLCAAGQTRGHTLDFTLQRRDTGQCYVAESKCELEYDNYRYLVLTDSDQIRHHASAAFAKLLTVARDPAALVVRRRGHPEPVDGAILVWGAATPEGRAAVMTDYGFADVLSIEAMVADLHVWSPVDWCNLLDRRRRWTIDLFDFLSGAAATAARTQGNEEEMP